MTKPYADMSYDELEARARRMDHDDWERAAIYAEQDRKSAVMTAICKLAAELDEEDWLLIPWGVDLDAVRNTKRWARTLAGSMPAVMGDHYADIVEAGIRRYVAETIVLLIPNHGETA